MNFDNYTNEEIFEFSPEAEGDLLAAVESFAEYEPGLISSESELSEMFDSMIDECRDAATLLEFSNGLNLPAIRKLFNNWADGLCKDGVLHSEQYSQYCYVGKFPN